jgi:hypothetical protein
VKRWDFVASLGLLAAVAVLYRNILRLWWTYDDAFHLHLCSTFPIGAMLFSRNFWQQLPNKVFTPLLFVSLKSDWNAWGNDARAFYIHHLVSLVVLAIAMYLVARLWRTPLPAFMSALLAISGPPFCEIAEQLFHRHYLEGLIFALASVGLFVRSIRSEKAGVWSAIAYFLAMAAKEVYVPLVVILLAIPERDWRARAKRLVPHFAAFSVYLIWRLAMLGPAVEAYGLTARRSEWPRMIATLPWRALVRLGGAGTIQSLVFLTLLGVCITLILIRDRAMRPLIVAMAVAALAPIVPVAMQIETRFVLTLWMCAVAAAAAAPRPLVALLLVAAIFANRAEWRDTFRKTDRMAREARFFTQMKRGDVLCNLLVPPAAMPELAWLTKSAGTWLYDDAGICGGEIRGRFFAWYEPLRSIRERAIPFVQRTSCREFAVMPLNAAFDSERHTLFWSLGPYRHGTYAFVLARGSQAFDVPRDGGFRIGDAPGFQLRVRYTSPAGWVTYSPEITLDFVHHPDLVWQRR